MKTIFGVWILLQYFPQAGLTATTEQNIALVNLTRLPITRVSASSVNNDRPLHDLHYGIRNLFDDTNHRWIAKARTSDQKDEWVNIRFLEPVTIYGLIIASTKSLVSVHPAMYELSVKNALYVISYTDKDGKEQSEELGPFKFVNNSITQEFNQPINNVNNFKIILTAANYTPIQLDKIQVFGVLSQNQDLKSVTPKIDGAVREKYWTDLDAMSCYDPPENLPTKRFVILKNKAVIVSNKNAILATISTEEKQEETKLKNNIYTIRNWAQSATISKDQNYLLIEKHLWEWTEDRDSYFHKEIGEYVSPGDPGKVIVDVYDLFGNKVLEKEIEAPVEYEHYCIGSPSQLPSQRNTNFMQEEKYTGNSSSPLIDVIKCAKD